MGDSQAPPLSAQLCFDLYAASRAVTAAYRPTLADLGLTYPQYLVLLVLWERDGRSVKEIAAELALDHGTLTPLLRRMEARDLVVRRKAEHDERYRVIALTGKGDALRAHATRIQCEMKAAMSLDEDQFAALQETLRTMTTRLVQHAGD